MTCQKFLLWLGLMTLLPGAALAADSCGTGPLTQGYGAPGPYGVVQQTVANPAFPRKDVIVFMPRGAAGKRPVIFFAHGFGPNRWGTYAPFFKHMVSRGDIVVYATYPMYGADMAQRYSSLWAGFMAATQAYGDKMDLTRVGFVGHSFGGGAVPAMAYEGLVGQHWGTNGAFTLSLAPWYTYQMTPAKWQALPRSTLQGVEVYDNDTVNDHRMAIDQYHQSGLAGRFYLMVDSTCGHTADHSTPGRSDDMTLKAYGLFRPFDMLADAAFLHSTEALKALADFGQAATESPYQPVVQTKAPQADKPQSFYQNPWNGAKNPASGASWQ